MKIVSSFGERIKEYRESNKFTLAEIENLTKVPAQTINRYELGQRIPKIDVAIQIAERLNLNPLWLFGYDTNHLYAIDQSSASSCVNLNKHEQKVISAYRNKEEMQPAVDRLLGIEQEETYNIAKAARGQKPLEMTKEQMKEFDESIKKAPNRSQDRRMF